MEVDVLARHGLWMIKRGCQADDGTGSIPEIEKSTDSIFNSATAYDPSGTSFIHVQVLLSIRGERVFASKKKGVLTWSREARRQAPKGPLVRYRHPRSTDIQGGLYSSLLHAIS